MSKVIFRESDYTELSFLYDDDGLTNESGENNALYIVNNYDYCPVNKKEYKALCARADEIATDIDDTINGYSSYFRNVKHVCEYYGFKYSPVMVKRLKAWAKGYKGSKDDIADFLTITTGEKWNTYTVCGYSQGEYATGIYCENHYSEDALELYVGAAAGTVTEFYRIEGDDVCCGFYVTDTTKWNTDTLKKELAGIYGDDPAEITIELFDGYTYVAKYTEV